MLNCNKVRTRSDIQAKDEKFVKKFVKRVQNDYWYISRKTPQRLIVYTVPVPMNKKYLNKIRRLEKTINNEAKGIFSITTGKDEYTVHFSEVEAQ